MASEPRRRIIPVFLPGAACPGDCVFCDQKSITGISRLPSRDEVSFLIREGMLKNQGKISEVEVAFYGGTFTAASPELMDGWLSACREAAPGSAIRISTRPDAMDPVMAAWLKERGVVTIELGCQSMDDRVLEASGRGHTAACCAGASRAVTGAGLVLGIQLMIGLLNQNTESFDETVKATVDLNPAFVRLYPVLVIRGTRLAELYRLGAYRPWDLETTVSALARALRSFRAAEIEVARVGLHGDAKQMDSIVVAGPAHPNIRELAEAALYLEKYEAFLQNGDFPAESTVYSPVLGMLRVRVSPGCVSRAVGPGRINSSAMSRLGWNLTVFPDPSLSDGSIVIAAEERFFAGTVWT